MTGSPPSGPAPPHALRAGDHKRPPDPPNPGRKDPRLTHLPSPPSTPCAERRRRGQGPSAAHAVGPRGPIPDPDAATGVAQKQRRTTEKRSTIRVSPSLTSPVPFRDDQCLVEAKARSSAAAFDSPVVRAQFAKRRRTLDTTAKSDGIVANHPQAGSERESGTRPGVAGTVAGTRQPDPANRRSDTDLFASESGTDGALSEAFQAG
jgi:hypothetical protein